MVAKTQEVAAKTIESLDRGGGKAAAGADKRPRAGSYVVAADGAEIVDLHTTLQNAAKNVSFPAPFAAEGNCTYLSFFIGGPVNRPNPTLIA